MDCRVVILMLCLSSSLRPMAFSRYVEEERSMIYTYERGMPYYCTFGSRKDINRQQFGIQDDCFRRFQNMVYYGPDGTPFYPFLMDGSPGGFILNCTTTIKNGKLVEPCNGLIHTTCGLTCGRGYNPVVKSVTCNLAQPYSNVSAVWSHPEPCVPQTCPAQIAHGKLTAPCDPVIRATCGITCESGYSPVVDSVTCKPGNSTTNGSAVWSHSDPCGLQSPSQRKTWTMGILIGCCVLFIIVLLIVVAACHGKGKCKRGRGPSISSSRDSLDKNVKEVEIPLINQGDSTNQDGPQPALVPNQDGSQPALVPNQDDPQPAQQPSPAVLQSAKVDLVSQDGDLPWGENLRSLDATSLSSEPSDLVVPNSPRFFPQGPEALSDKHILDYPSVMPGSVRSMQDSYYSEACISGRVRAEPTLSSGSQPLELLKDVDYAMAEGKRDDDSPKESTERCNTNVKCLLNCFKSDVEKLIGEMEPSGNVPHKTTLYGYVTQTQQQIERLKFHNLHCFDVEWEKHQRPGEYFAKEILRRMANHGDTVPDVLDFFEHTNPKLVQLILKLHGCDKCRTRYSYKSQPS
ncbi:hypothetical protein ElyMa_006900900 [Elysia marginata]|uniref:Sushi domain-containing protein n=1 Tax=Elysia marginata TaxID=1093978 RepID=A0AAV4JFL9_9GAST|nr:hypothetical protein ElyMa_006900900 [Elysia marginata]